MNDTTDEAPVKRLKTDHDDTSSKTKRHLTWRVYPVPGQKIPSFQPSDVVYFRPKTSKEWGKQGTVVEAKADDENHVWVQYSSTGEQASKPTCVSCKRLIPVLLSNNTSTCSSGTTIILTPETAFYRHLACSQISQADDILEIGCSTGEATALLLRNGRSLICFDTSAGMIAQCQQKVELLAKAKGEDVASKPFAAVKIDALADPSSALVEAKRFGQSHAPVVVFLDIGGNREETGVVKMLGWVLDSFPQLKLLVVKSRELVKDVSAKCVTDNGVIRNGTGWFQAKIQGNSIQNNIPRHPLQAPLVMSPVDPSKPICRYHNYHGKGCSKLAQCPYDHKHCHRCLQEGHIAKNCPNLKLYG